MRRRRNGHNERRATNRNATLPRTRTSSIAAASELRYQNLQLEQQLQATHEDLTATKHKYATRLEQVEADHAQELEEWRKRYHKLESQQQDEADAAWAQWEKDLKRQKDSLRAKQEDWDAFEQEEVTRIQQEQRAQEEEWAQRMAGDEEKCNPASY